MTKKQTRKNPLLWFFFVILIIGWSTAVYEYPLVESQNQASPDMAIKHYVKSHHWSNATKIKVLPDRAALNAGYFMVAVIEPDMYQLFYAWYDKGKWNVVNCNSINPHVPSFGTGVPLDFGRNDAKAWLMSIVCRPGESNTAAAAGYARMSGGKAIPYSLTQIGSLPIWVCMYPGQHGLFMDHAEGYDHLGNVVWTTMD